MKLSLAIWIAIFCEALLTNGSPWDIKRQSSDQSGVNPVKINQIRNYLAKGGLLGGQISKTGGKCQRIVFTLSGGALKAQKRFSGIVFEKSGIVNGKPSYQSSEGLLWWAPKKKTVSKGSDKDYWKVGYKGFIPGRFQNLSQNHYLSL